MKSTSQMQGLGLYNINITTFFDQIPRYQYCDNVVGMTIGALTKY